MTGTPVRRTEDVDVPDHAERQRWDSADRDVLPGKTSAAATFALVFGLASLFCALTGILAPLALAFGALALVLGVVGTVMTRRPRVTGGLLALAGIVTAALGLALAALVYAGMSDRINEMAHLDTLQSKINDLRVDPPSAEQVTRAVTD